VISPTSCRWRPAQGAAGQGEPVFEAVATTGVGVFETLKACARHVLMELRKG